MFVTFVLPTSQRVTLVLRRKNILFMKRIFLGRTFTLSINHSISCSISREDSFVFASILNRKITL